MEKLHTAIELGRYLVGSAATQERQGAIDVGLGWAWLRSKGFVEVR
jgi:hypothetical protein